MSDIFFIIGAPRSATTSYARMLDTATNAEVFVEQAPKLRRPSRDLIKGTLADPPAALLANRRDLIETTLRKGLKYGDKNPCYLPFIPYLHRQWDCKFVLLTRNPREVLRSMMSFWTIRQDGLFNMPEDGGPENKTPDDDPWDYSRLRPNPGDGVFDDWREMTHLEKCAWYWAAFNATALEAFSALPPEKSCIVDVSDSNPSRVRSLFDFFDLEGFDQHRIQEMLDASINSVEEKTGRSHPYPAYSEWTEEQNAVFDRYVAPVSERLGYPR